MSSEYIIHPSQIEKQLSQIWDSLQGAKKMRACLFNLIIYTKKNPRMDYLYKISQKLIEKFPSRIIFITIDEVIESPTLKTSVSVVSAGDANSPIACDLINIILSKHNQERAKFLLLPHILPDLPIYLVWGDDPSKNNPLTAQLEKLATRVIFDSESTDNLATFSHALLDHKKLGSDIADLNWARIEGWRQLMIDTFKSLDKIDQLNQLNTITLCYNSKETDFFCHTKIQAIYLQGWIANQLNWQFDQAKQEKDCLCLIYKNKGRSIRVILTPKTLEKLAPGYVISLSLQMDNQQQYLFARNKDQEHIINIHYSTADFCELPSQFIFDRYESGQSLIKEIFHQGTSAHYLSLIQKVQQLPKELISL